MKLPKQITHTLNLVRNANAKESINELNNQVKAKLAPSSIHGIGVFAIRSIAKGEKLYCEHSWPKTYSIPTKYLKDIREEVRQLIIEHRLSVQKGGSFFSPNNDVILSAFMNHSINPNYDPKTDCALRDIVKGEEITENYNDFGFNQNCELI